MCLLQGGKLNKFDTHLNITWLPLQDLSCVCCTTVFEMLCAVSDHTILRLSRCISLFISFHCFNFDWRSSEPLITLSYKCVSTFSHVFVTWKQTVRGWIVKQIAVFSTMNFYLDCGWVFLFVIFLQAADEVKHSVAGHKLIRKAWTSLGLLLNSDCAGAVCGLAFLHVLHRAGAWPREFGLPGYFPSQRAVVRPLACRVPAGTLFTTAALWHSWWSPVWLYALRSSHISGECCMDGIGLKLGLYFPNCLIKDM